VVTKFLEKQVGGMSGMSTPFEIPLEDVSQIEIVQLNKDRIALAIIAATVVTVVVVDLATAASFGP
jgi:hypothetical protein